MEIGTNNKMETEKKKRLFIQVFVEFSERGEVEDYVIGSGNPTRSNL